MYCIALSIMSDHVKPTCDLLARHDIEWLRKDATDLIPVSGGSPWGSGEPPLNGAVNRDHLNQEPVY